MQGYVFACSSTVCIVKIVIRENYNERTIFADVIRDACSLNVTFLKDLRVLSWIKGVKIKLLQPNSSLVYFRVTVQCIATTIRACSGHDNNSSLLQSFSRKVKIFSRRMILKYPEHSFRGYSQDVCFKKYLKRKFYKISKKQTP